MQTLYAARSLSLDTSLMYHQVVQNVVVELQYKESISTVQVAKRPNAASQRSVYVGWTGMASTAKSTSIADRNGRKAKEEISVVEIDATFGRMLGLMDGQKVRTIG